FALVTFSFPTPVLLSSGTTYYIGLGGDGGKSLGTLEAQTIVVGLDTSSPGYANGQYYQWDGNWSARAWEAVFYTYTSPTYITLQSYSEATIKTQGSYALKVVAAITDSLNKTLTYTFDPPLDLTGIQALKFDMQSTRTGDNVKVELHDSGGTTTELTPTIGTADEYETKTVDLSGVSDANKDAIDTLIFTQMNADAATTWYIDNFYAVQAMTMTFDDDVVTLSEAFSKGTAKKFNETMTITDLGIVRAITRQFNELVTLTDTFRKFVSKVFLDGVTLSDVFTIVKTYIFHFIETVTLVDLGIIRVMTKKFVEVATLSETFGRKMTKYFKETVTLSEVFTKAKGFIRHLYDVVTLTDMMKFWMGIGNKVNTWVKGTPSDGIWTKETPGTDGWTRHD
ncbi:MAG: hypothetical protein WC364_15320, partial [Eubacteriales bacterium]